ncbi:MAG TPA: heme peroxidase family protein [Pyrinomonadaceae bacterium]|nr:heme peroxidase family protein [Pyrinomonadaceae bacterium]
MARFRHGAILPLEPTANYAKEGDARRVASNECKPPSWPFGFMFPELQHDPMSLLETSKRTVSNLRRLGSNGMNDPPIDKAPGVQVPAIYTFFGQFVDHDITREKGSSMIQLSKPYPIDPKLIPLHIVNSRSPNLDLDHVYGPDVDGQFAPRDPNDRRKLLIEEVGPGVLGPIPGKDPISDLPRRADGTPRIGDRRNDENIVVSQLHVAFLKAHNVLVDEGLSFEGARKLLTQHYQWIVLDDFLDRIADPNIVKRIRDYGARFFNPSSRSLFMPLEFSVAAFRFGHSKVRAAYNEFNCKNVLGGLDLLFSNAHQRLSEDWVIDWKAFLKPEDNLNLPRPIDTSLTDMLLKLGKDEVDDNDPEGNLAIRNLLRGYILRLPTGQAVAKAMASQGVVPLIEQQLRRVAEEIPDQLGALKGTDFLTRTPLWFYILAEASYYSRGYHLGPVGSTIVAEVLIGVLRNSTYSILSVPDWRPTLGQTTGRFDLKDLLSFAGVL